MAVPFATVHPAFVPDAETVGAEVLVIETEVCAVHPFASVTITV